MKAIRAVFKWGVRKKGSDGKPLAPGNPARDVPYLKSNNPSGYHTWSLDEVHQFEERHPIGTKARLALALFLCTGQRRSDITRLGRQHVRSGKLTFTQYKGRNRKPKRLTLPILPALQRIIDASPCGEMTFLVNDLGRPFTDAGFGNWFRDRCVEASVPGRAHGLRKARRDHRGQQRRDRAPAHGDFWLGHTQDGGGVHARSRSTAVGAKRNAHARYARTKQHRIMSHRSARWDFFQKNVNGTP